MWLPVVQDNVSLPVWFEAKRLMLQEPQSRRVSWKDRPMSRNIINLTAVGIGGAWGASASSA